jgi:hypothetical protein
LGERKVEDLPAATLGAARVQAKGDAGIVARLWPGAQVPGKTTVLWAVLLAGVAWTLLRQLKRTDPPKA